MFVDQLPSNRRQKSRRYLSVNQQRFHGVANSRPLDFGIHRDFLSHLEVSLRIDKDMTNAFVMFYHGNFRAFSDRANEALTAARHAQIDVLSEGKEFFDSLAIGGGD